MNILMIGDIYSKLGREIFADKINDIVSQNKIDFIIVNGENTTHGKSISKNHYDLFKSLGVDVITSGNHIFKNKEVKSYIDSCPDLLKPLNMSKYTPGNGFILCEKNNKKIAVVNLMGKSFMDHCNNPYEAMEEFIQNNSFDILLVDFHAEASAEKMAFAWNYDGIITAFAGTHTHIQTADERILPKGTAYITDLGMTGSINSIIGANPKQVIEKEKTGMPAIFEPSSEGPSVLNGVIISIDNETNKATEIKRIKEMG